MKTITRVESGITKLREFSFLFSGLRPTERIEFTIQSMSVIEMKFSYNFFRCFFSYKQLDKCAKDSIDKMARARREEHLLKGLELMQFANMKLFCYA